MIEPKAVRERMRADPFVPFQIHLTDQRVFTVLHPFNCIVQSRRLLIGIPSEKDTRISDKIVDVDAKLLDRVEVLQPVPAAVGA